MFYLRYELKQLATFSCHPKRLLATKVQSTTSTPPSTSVTTHATGVVGGCRQSKYSNSRRHVTIRHSIDWKPLDFVFKPLHARFDSTLEGCADDDDPNSHGDLPHISPSDYVFKRHLSGERLSVNPTWELVDQIARHVESGSGATPTYMEDVIVLPKWAKFNDIARHSKLYPSFSCEDTIVYSHVNGRPDQA
jgi:hypothetical protein